MVKKLLVVIVFLVLLAACSGPEPAAQGRPPAADTATATALQVSTDTPSPSIAQTTPTPSATGTPSGPDVCMPFGDNTLIDMVRLVSNPYDPPEIGIERVHQGLDFALTDAATGAAISGAPVQAVLGGRVAAVLLDRFPYGTAVLIESDMTDLGLMPDLVPDLPQAPLQFSSLNCPEGSGDYAFSSSGSVSLYLLYAHLEAVSSLVPGDRVEACTVLGTVGMSGNALNPHLHLEARIGPSALTFSSMAHYDNSASLDEMANYCFWRVSGFYHFIDPMLVLELGE
jgi:murein DD-endopeptidase MepM/ murein hydrolase activator NlpD